MIAYNYLETLTRLRLEDVEREWRMAALAAQLPRCSRPGYRDRLARGLRRIARYLDPDLTTSAERGASASV